MPGQSSIIETPPRIASTSPLAVWEPQQHTAPAGLAGRYENDSTHAGRTAPPPRMIAGSELTLTYDAWSAALLEVLLPRLSAERWGQVALLCCDDEAVHAAANGLGSAANEPAAEFGRLVEGRFHIGPHGSPARVRRGP